MIPGLRRAFAPLLAIAIVFVIFFWPATVGGRFIVISDALVYSYPLRMVAWEAIRNLSLPLWTPVLLSGYPLLSMAQLGLAYPLTWGYLFLPGHWAEQIYVLAPFLLSPAFTYAYAREIGRSRAAALLAGLAFTYGGMMAGGLASNGMFTNAVMWLPLVLVAIERSRRGRFVPSMLGVAAAYAMSVLTGIGQAFLYTGLIAASYAFFVSLIKTERGAERGIAEAGSAVSAGGGRAMLVWRRIQPLTACLCGMALATGVAAFQILETLRAQRRSIRSTLSYEVFSGGSLSPETVWKSFLLPYHNANWEVTTYVAPLAALLALVALISALRSPRADLRVFFWLAVAATGFLLMLGDRTPLYRIAYHIPVLNLFRVPWRHAFEWTLAISILSSYGWDAQARFLARSFGGRLSPRRREIAIGALLLGGSIAIGAGWWEAAGGLMLSNPAGPPQAISQSEWLLWKAGLAVAALLTVWWCMVRVASSGWRSALMMAAIGAACFVEPHLLLSRWWFPLANPGANFEHIPATSRLLRRFPPEENRIYTSTDGGLEALLPNVELHNLSARRGLHNAAGYEPLMLDRYARALGDHTNFATPSLAAPLDRMILDPRSRVLDLLNIRLIVLHSNSSSSSLSSSSSSSSGTFEKDGTRFALGEAKVSLGPGESVRLSGAEEAEVDTLSLVTTMANSGHLAQGEPVARVVVRGAQGQISELRIAAGVDTAEWAHERADVKAVIRHALAPVYDQVPGDAENSFPACRYFTRLALGAKTRVESVEIINLDRQASIVISKATLYDSSSGWGRLLGVRMPEHWLQIYDRDGVEIYRNERAMPRAWLVARGEAVDAEEALRRIRGESGEPFDPAATALLETAPGALGDLAGGSLGADAGARITSYEPNRLVVETKAERPAVLVLSEINYPGWAARIDGRETSILTANYLLRGVIVPAGSHRVEMWYRAPAARSGAVISGLTILTLAGLAAGERRRRRRHESTPECRREL